MKTLRSSCAVLLLLGAFVLRSQALDLGFAKEDAGQPGAFLDFAASARSLSMGHAGVGMGDDASAGYLNPAGLSQLQRKDFVSLYSLLPEQSGYGFFSYAQPTLDYGSFGLSVVSLRSGNFNKRDSIGADIGSFSQAETAFLYSHSVRYNKRWSFGATFKAIREEIDTYSAMGYGFDAGTMVHIRPGLQTGLAVTNILAPQIKLRSVADKYPRDIRFGVMAQPGSRFTILTDLIKPEKRSLKVRFGTEYKLARFLSLRAGINESEITAGMGIELKDWGLDYAFGYNDAAAGVQDLGNSHRFGVHIRFGSSIVEQGSSARWQKRAKSCLADLRGKMDTPRRRIDSKEMDRLLANTDEVIKQKGFINPSELYAAQGYIHYFQKEFEKSILSLGEALALALATAAMARASAARAVSRSFLGINPSFACSSDSGSLPSCFSSCA